MQDYYFAHRRLRVTDGGEFLSRSRLAGFSGETAYDCEAELRLTYGACPDYANALRVSGASGIDIFDLAGTKWLFTVGAPGRRFGIEANRGCSLLRAYVEPGASSAGDDFFQLLRIASECGLAHHTGVSIHASCVSVNGKAVLFTAPSGTGKSTQAELWKKVFGARILSGDRPLLRMEQGKLYACGVPWDGKEQLFLQEEYPVSAVVEVRRAPSNSLRRLSADQAFRLLMKQCFIPMWDDAAKFAVMATLRRLAKDVAFYRLFCLPDAGAAELVRDILFGNEQIRAREERPDMKLKEGFVLKNILDEWIAMPTGANIRDFEGAIVLNEVSAHIWRQLEKPVSRDDLLKSVLDEYDVDEQTAAADLDELLARLKSLDILQVG